MTDIDLGNLIRCKSTKVVYVAKMTDAEYRAFHHTHHKSNSMATPAVSITRDIKQGYLVVYNKGEPNEYLSWSPAQEVRSGYINYPERTSHSENPYDNAKWGVCIFGPDETLAASCFEEAVEQAARFNANVAYYSKPECNSPHYPMMWANIFIWDEQKNGPHDPSKSDWDNPI